MAEFQEVCKQWRRMCAHGSEDYACADCNMYSSVDESVCRGIPDKDEAKIIEGFVMQWAAEHPEPVYPTWGEWLVSVGAARKIPSGIPFKLANVEIVDPPWETVVAIHDHIPADIAEKLGIEPKERRGSEN